MEERTNDQPIHSHTPLTDPTNGKEETIGGLFDGLRARVCAVCGMLYVPHELMHAWRDHRVTVASKADAQRASSGPLAVALRRRALQEADAEHDDDDDDAEDDDAEDSEERWRLDPGWAWEPNKAGDGWCAINPVKNAAVWSDGTCKPPHRVPESVRKLVLERNAAGSPPLNHRSASAVPDGSADTLAGVMVYGKVGSDHHVRLWDAINAFAVASGGSADAVNPARMAAVARIESLLQFLPSNPNREKTTP